MYCENRIRHLLRSSLWWRERKDLSGGSEPIRGSRFMVYGCAIVSWPELFLRDVAELLPVGRLLLGDFQVGEGLYWSVRYGVHC